MNKERVKSLVMVGKDSYWVSFVIKNVFATQTFPPHEMLAEITSERNVLEPYPHTSIIIIMSLNCFFAQCCLWNDFWTDRIEPSCEQRSHAYFECFVVKDIDERIGAADHERHDLRSIEGES